jgi:hypothetical protein
MVASVSRPAKQTLRRDDLELTKAKKPDSIGLFDLNTPQNPRPGPQEQPET